MVPLCLRGDLQAAWDKLEQSFNTADTTLSGDVLETGRSAEAAVIAQSMEDLRLEMIESTVFFTLRALPRKTWRKKIAEHPPGEDDEGDVDEEGFITDLVATCCVDPVMTSEQSARLRDELTEGQWQSLAQAAWELNKGVLSIPFSLAAQTSAALAGIHVNT